LIYTLAAVKELFGQHCNTIMMIQLCPCLMGTVGPTMCRLTLVHYYWRNTSSSLNHFWIGYFWYLLRLCHRL